MNFIFLDHQRDFQRNFPGNSRAFLQASREKHVALPVSSPFFALAFASALPDPFPLREILSSSRIPHEKRERHYQQIRSFCDNSTA